jgi:hypothetical protein
MKYFTKYKPTEIVEILSEQIESAPDYRPSFKFWGTSPVFGTVDEKRFKLRKRAYPSTLATVIGKMSKTDDGTIIDVKFQKPNKLLRFFCFGLLSYKYDYEIIVNFLKEWIKLNKIPEPVI